MRTTSSTNSSDEFDVYRVRDAFTLSLREKSNHSSPIGTQDYIDGYRHLLKFVDQLGWIFGFVKDDVVEKLGILQTFLDTDDQNAKHFDSIQQGIHYEIEMNLIRQNPLNFSRTLLRLHRALRFIFEFLRQLNDRPQNDSTHSIAHHVYEETLSKYHGFLIRQSVKIGFRMLPTRRRLDEIIYHRNKTEDLINEYQSFLNTLENIYQIIQQFYQEKNLLDLP